MNINLNFYLCRYNDYLILGDILLIYKHLEFPQNFSVSPIHLYRLNGI